jgi:hypothetical protein
VPLAGEEEEDDVDEAAEDPAYNAYKVPVAAHAQVLVAGHEDYGGVVLLLVQGVS